MATNTAGTVGRQLGKQVIHTLRRDFTFADQTEMTVGYLPPGAIVIGAGALVVTAFNSDGTDLLDIGVSGTAEGIAADIDLATPGLIVGTTSASTTLYSATGQTVVATYAVSGSAPTTGVASVFVRFIPDNDL